MDADEQGDTHEGRVARLASLVECSPDEAGRALELARGDFAVAVRVLFEGPEAAAQGAAAAPLFGLGLAAPIDLEDSDDDVAAPASLAPVVPAAAPAAAAAAPASPLPASRRRSRSPLAPLPPRAGASLLVQRLAERCRDRVAEALAGLGGQAAGSGAGATSGGAGARLEADAVGKRGPKRKAGGANAAEGKRAKRGQNQEQAAEEPSDGLPTAETLRDQSWVVIEMPGSTSDTPGSLAWAKSFLSKELWSLSLGPAKSKDMPTETNAAVFRHVERSDRLADFKPTKQSLRIILSALRYPPSSLECWWRESTQSLKPKKAAKMLSERSREPPPDLTGSLGVRPFPLRNNLGGPEARQPPHFDAHLLRPEQLRSLAWMLGQELPEALPFGVEWRRYYDWHRRGDSQLTSRSADVWVLSPPGQWEKTCTLPAGTKVTTRGPPWSQGNMITGYYLMQSITEPKEGAVEVKTLDTMQTVAQHELRVHGHYEVRGGILADRIGYGKTATTIGLIDSTLDKPLPEVPRVDRGRFKPVKATLILTPSNLLDQWINEIGKFVHDGNAMRLVGGWGPKECPLKVFALKSVTPLKGATVRQIAEADIVICSYRLLYSNVYQARRDAILGERKTSLHDLAMATERAMQSRPSGNHGGECKRLRQPAKQAPGQPAQVPEAAECANIDDLMFPLLEQFYWRRVVFDEFHELESFQSAQQVSLQHMRAHYRWGLTGTPPVGSNAGVIFMSSLFRIDLPGNLAGPDISNWENDKVLTQMSLRFLDRYARQNAAELPEIPLEEEIVRVSHTAAERALYLGQAHDAPDLSSGEAFSTPERVQALQQLLKLCSHFRAGGGESAESAADECRRIGAQKERRSARAAQALERCCLVLLLLEGKLRRLVAAENAALQRQLQDFKRLLTRPTWASPQAPEEVSEAVSEAVSAAVALELGAPEEAAQIAADALGSARGAQVDALAQVVGQMLAGAGSAKPPDGGPGDLAAHLAERLPDAVRLACGHADEALRARLRERVVSWRGAGLLPPRALLGVELAAEVPPEEGAKGMPPGGGPAAEGDEAAAPARAGLASPAPAPAPAAAAAAPGLPEAAAWRERLRCAIRALRDEGGGDSAPGRRSAATLESTLARVQREGPLQRLCGLEGHKASDESGLVAFLGPAPPRSGHTREQWSAFAATPLSREALGRLMEAQADEQVKNLQELRGALASQDFFFKAVSTMRENSSPEARSCSVCLEDDLPLTKLSITPCAHTFCTECLKATVKNFGSCSICRQKLTEKDVVPIEFELDAGVEGAAKSSTTSSAAGGSAASSSSAGPAVPDKFACYGTKLARLVQKLQQLRLEDSTAKAILFVQFDDLKRKVASALAEFGIPAATLQGNATMRGRTIREWQENHGSSTFVLLLSLDESASGANLTAASHVVFLHPMLAPSTETAAAFELQAIGRARRFGQRRAKVCVWRFVTADTIEQDLTERHQAALWARAGAEAAAAGAGAAAAG